MTGVQTCALPILKHGNAYGEGIPGSDHGEKNALRSAYAGGTGKGAIITPDGAVLRPLQPGDPMYDTMQKWNAYMDGINHNVEKSAPNSMYDYNRRMHEIVNQINHVSNVVNNRNVQQPVNNTFNITMPNVTNSTSAEALMRDLQSLSTKKFQVNWDK